MTTTKAEGLAPPKAGTELNGGTLVRAAKVCDCKIPNLLANKIEAGDEWTCSCKQGWRARVGGASKSLHWKRISTKPRKPRKKAVVETAGDANPPEGLVPPQAG
jgi:hypothetical protein